MAGLLPENRGVVLRRREMNTKRVLRMMAVAAAWSGATAHAWDKSENQLWLQGSAETTVYKKVTERVAENGSVESTVSQRVKLKVAEQFRFKDGDEFQHQTDFQVCYLPGGGWSLAGTFRYIDKERTSGDWEANHAGIADLSKTQQIGGLELKGRLRAMYTDKFGTDDDPWEIRPRLDVAPVKGWTSWKLKPYLADEVMYDLSGDNLYRNRVYVGLKAAPHKKVGTNVYLMQECKESDAGDWHEYFVVGFSAALKF